MNFENEFEPFEENDDFVPSESNSDYPLGKGGPIDDREFEELANELRNVPEDPRYVGKKAHRDQLRYIRRHLEDSIQLCREVVSLVRIKHKVVTKAIKIIQEDEGQSQLKNPEILQELQKEMTILKTAMQRFERSLDNDLEPVIESACSDLADLFRKQIQIIEIVEDALGKDLS